MLKVILAQAHSKGVGQKGAKGAAAAAQAAQAVGAGRVRAG